MGNRSRVEKTGSGAETEKKRDGEQERSGTGKRKVDTDLEKEM